MKFRFFQRDFYILTLKIINREFEQSYKQKTDLSSIYSIIFSMHCDKNHFYTAKDPGLHFNSDESVSK